MRNTSQRRRGYSRQQNQPYDQERNTRERGRNQTYDSRSRGEEYSDVTRGEDQNRQYDYFDELNSHNNLPGYSRRRNEGYNYENGGQYIEGGQQGRGSYEQAQTEDEGQEWGFGRGWNQDESQGNYTQRGQRRSTGNQTGQSQSGSGQSYNGGSTYGEHRGKGPKGYQRSDERILENVNDQLSDDGEVDASEIEVKVDQGEVTLTGTVTSKEAKRRAEDIVETISGVKNVENRLRVVSESHTSSKSTSGSSRSESTAGSERTKTK